MLDRYDPRNWPISYEGVIHTLIVLGSAVLLALVAHWVVFALLRRLARSSESTIDDMVVEAVRKPLRILGEVRRIRHHVQTESTVTVRCA